jgi:hypothetical protein
MAFSKELIERIQNHFRLNYYSQISEEEANDYLDNLAKLFIINLKVRNDNSATIRKI